MRKEFKSVVMKSYNEPYFYEIAYYVLQTYFEPN